MSEELFEKVFTPFNEKTQNILNKVRTEINSDAILKKLDEEYDVEEMLLFNEFNIKEKIERNPEYQMQFRLLFFAENAKLEKLKQRLDKETGEKYQSLKEGAVSLTKTEIEKYYLTTDPELTRIKGAIVKQELRVRFFEVVCKAFESQQWNMKNWAELSKSGW